MRRPIRLKGLAGSSVEMELPHDLIYLAYRGSIAHGMYVPQDHPDSIDDKDLIGVFIGPASMYLGLGRFGPYADDPARRDVIEIQDDPWDVVAYELVKLTRLLLKGNPNVLSLLWTDSRHVVLNASDSSHAWFDPPINAFVSKQAYHSFRGYAYDQRKKMTAFNLKEFEELERMEGDPGVKPDDPRLRELQRKFFSGYMGHKRKELVRRFGFDTKNAAHLIRLQRMCVEFLTEGRLYVERKDASDLLSIKRGEVPLEKVLEESARLFALMDDVYTRSDLPPSPDYSMAEEWLMDTLQSYMQMYGWTNG